MPTITRHGRAFCYDTSIPADDLLRDPRSEKEMAGVFATETCHPARFEIPRHAHDLPSFYVVLEGSLTEFYDRNLRDVRTSGVVLTPPGEIHSNAFHEAGGRCFLVELSTGLIVLAFPRGDLTPRSCATDESPRGK